jgi:TonB family protein
MICSNCGNVVEAIHRFCPKCGAPMQTQAPPPGAPYNPPPYSAPTMGGPAPLPQKKSGCGKIILIIAIILVIIGAGIAAAIYYGYRYTERMLKSSEAYTVALNALKDNDEVREQIGDVVETGFPLGAYSQDAGGSGKAAFVMSVTGTKSKGKYQVELTRRNSVWHLDNGTFTSEAGTFIRISGRSPTPELTPDTSNANNVATAPRAKGAPVSGGVLNGKAISLPKAEYPSAAKAAKASGSVSVQVLIDESGNVISAKAVTGHPLLRAAAETAAKNAKFKPTILSGTPVKVQGIIVYNFTAE